MNPKLIKQDNQQNVFLVSMYFILPLTSVSDDYIETDERQYKELQVPHGVHESIFRCAYYDGIKEDSTVFYFNHDSEWNKIVAVPYILNCQEKLHLEEVRYYLKKPIKLQINI